MVHTPTRLSDSTYTPGHTPRWWLCGRCLEFGVFEVGAPNGTTSQWFWRVCTFPMEWSPWGFHRCGPCWSSGGTRCVGGRRGHYGTGRRPGSYSTQTSIHLQHHGGGTHTLRLAPQFSGWKDGGGHWSTWTWFCCGAKTHLHGRQMQVGTGNCASGATAPQACCKIQAPWWTHYTWVAHSSWNPTSCRSRTFNGQGLPEQDFPQPQHWHDHATHGAQSYGVCSTSLWSRHMDGNDQAGHTAVDYDSHGPVPQSPTTPIPFRGTTPHVGQTDTTCCTRASPACHVTVATSEMVWQLHWHGCWLPVGNPGLWAHMDPAHTDRPTVGIWPNQGLHLAAWSTVQPWCVAPVYPSISKQVEETTQAGQSTCSMAESNSLQCGEVPRTGTTLHHKVRDWHAKHRNDYGGACSLLLHLWSDLSHLQRMGCSFLQTTFSHQQMAKASGRTYLPCLRQGVSLRSKVDTASTLSSAVRGCGCVCGTVGGCGTILR